MVFLTILGFSLGCCSGGARRILTQDQDQDEYTTGDFPVSASSIYRTGPNNQEYLFFKFAFETIDLHQQTRMSGSFETAINLANAGFIDWRLIQDLRVNLPGLDGYHQALALTEARLNGRINRNELQTLIAHAQSVRDKRQEQYDRNQHGQPDNHRNRRSHLRILNWWIAYVQRLAARG